MRTDGTHTTGGRLPLKPFRVKLTCGCTVVTRNNPMRHNTTYPCPSGMGHGYSVSWTSWEDTVTGLARVNGEQPVKAVPGVRPSERVDFVDVSEGDRLHFGTERSDARSTLWRDGTVVAVSRKSVYVDCADGSCARLDGSRWAYRGVTRYTD